MPAKVALDSNIFVDAFRSPIHEQWLAAFHERHAPTEYLSAVVALELRAGAATPATARRLERHVFAPFERRGRIFSPSYSAWKAAGGAAARLRGHLTRSFYNDILIAASCREHGVILITRNGRDFERIAALLPFRFVAAQ